MIDSETAIKRNQEKREHEERIARQLRESEELEQIEPLSFSGLGYELGRQGNKRSSWECPIGAQSN